MKFLFILLASLITFTSQATDVTPAVLKSFNSTFGNAKEVSWNASNQLFQARFTLDGQYVNAYYNAEGGLVALNRNLALNQLPVLLQAGLKSQSADSWISDIAEYTTSEGTFYYATLENADMKITLRSKNNSEWSTYQKISKI